MEITVFAKIKKSATRGEEKEILVRCRTNVKDQTRFAEVKQKLRHYMSKRYDVGEDAIEFIIHKRIEEV